MEIITVKAKWLKTERYKTTAIIEMMAVRFPKTCVKAAGIPQDTELLPSAANANFALEKFCILFPCLLYSQKDVSDYSVFSND